MRFLWKISRIVDRWRLLVWILGTLATFVAPLVGYLSYLLAAGERHAQTVSDSPEYADDMTAASLLQWLTGQARSAAYGRILGVIAVIEILILLFAFTFTVISWVGRRTEVSGTDEESETLEKGRREAEKDDQYDDYGQSMEY